MNNLVDIAAAAVRRPAAARWSAALAVTGAALLSVGCAGAGAGTASAQESPSRDTPTTATSATAARSNAPGAVALDAAVLDRAASGGGSGGDHAQLSYVRQQALRESAQSLGVRLGLTERSRELLRAVEQRAAQFDASFNFGGLSMGPGVLPPVISAAQDAVTMGDKTMRVSSALYRIDEPARFGSVTWRDWLLLGLSAHDSVDLSALGELLPRDGAERAYWEAVSSEARAAGVAQAEQMLRNNMAALERAYSGMRTYYDLYKRGMVSAPVLASAHTVLDQQDPNTIAVGNTVFQITQDAGFRATDRWVPLE